MRIAVYAPAKNEADNVADWATSAEAADEIVLVDTGSEDDTYEKAQALSVKVSRAVISPWRFDYGMNVALAQVSADIDVAVCLHLDDRLLPGWREELGRAGEAGQYTFLYEWSSELTYRHDRIHARHGYRWVGAAHESLVGPGSKVDTNLRMRQVANSRDRTADSGLIHLAYEENPTARTLYYSAREHYYRNEWDRARDKFAKYLAESTYGEERSEACRIVARMVWPHDRERWLLRAVYESPQRRECWMDLALYYKDAGKPFGTKYAVSQALAIAELDANNSYHVEAKAWDDDYLKSLLRPAAQDRRAMLRR